MEACFKGEEKEEEPTVLLAAAERKVLPSLFFSPLQVAVVCLWQLPADSCCTHLPIIMIDLLFFVEQSKANVQSIGSFSLCSAVFICMHHFSINNHHQRSISSGNNNSSAGVKKIKREKMKKKKKLLVLVLSAEKKERKLHRQSRHSSATYQLTGRAFSLPTTVETGSGILNAN